MTEPLLHWRTLGPRAEPMALNPRRPQGPCRVLALRELLRDPELRAVQRAASGHGVRGTRWGRSVFGGCMGVCVREAFLCGGEVAVSGGGGCVREEVHVYVGGGGGCVPEVWRGWGSCGCGGADRDGCGGAAWQGLGSCTYINISVVFRGAVSGCQVTHSLGSWIYLT